MEKSTLTITSAVALPLMDLSSSINTLLSVAAPPVGESLGRAEREGNGLGEVDFVMVGDSEVVGIADGSDEGRKEDDGVSDGLSVGFRVGLSLGDMDVVGIADGSDEGHEEDDGVSDGLSVGFREGLSLGDVDVVGAKDGT
jgi:hypothetical protein